MRCVTLRRVPATRPGHMFPTVGDMWPGLSPFRLFLQGGFWGSWQRGLWGISLWVCKLRLSPGIRAISQSLYTTGARQGAGASTLNPGVGGTCPAIFPAMWLSDAMAIPRGMLIVSAKLGRRRQKQIQLQCESGKLVRLRRGIYVERGKFHELKRWEKFTVESIAAGVSRPANVLVGKSAAAVWDIPYGAVPTTIELGGPAGGSGSTDKSLKFRRCGELPGQVRHRLAPPFESVQVTSLPQTLLDVARWHGVVDGVQAIDHCLNNRSVLREMLEALLPGLTGRNGVAEAALALELSNAAAESPRESVLRIRMWFAGLPSPHLQAAIRDERGTPLGRVDFFYPEYSLVIEYDGQGKYQGAFGLSPERAALAEMHRHKELNNAGLRVVRITADTFHDGSWIADLRRALAWGKRSGEPFPPDQWDSAGLAWQRSRRRRARSE